MKSLKNKKKEIADLFVKESILNAAIEILQKEGAKALTMDKVAAGAKLAKGTMYLHFKNKEELIKELVIKIKKPMFDEFLKIKKMDIQVAEKIEKIFFYMLENIENNLSFVRVVIQAVDSCDNLKAFIRKDDEDAIKLFAEILKAGKKNDEIIVDNPDYAAKMIFACLIYMIRERGEGHGDFMPVKKEVELFMRVFNLGVNRK